MTETLPSRAPQSLALLAAVMIPVAAVAQTVTFNFVDGSEGATSFSATVSGITMTIPSFTGGGSNFHVSGDAMGLLIAPSVWVSGFQFSFNTPVKITGYTVGEWGATMDGNFDLTSGATGDALGNSLANPLSPAPTFVDLTSANYTLNAFQSGTFTMHFDPGDYAVLQSFTVTAIPEPQSWPLMAGACGGVIAIGLRRWRRRRDA